MKKEHTLNLNQTKVFLELAKKYPLPKEEKPVKVKGA